MRHEAFRESAGRMYDNIPAAFRRGISGVTVERAAKGHPTLPGIWTLGECVTDQWPDATGGIADTRSEIVLYYGSFEKLAVGDRRFDWEAELWETMLHELLHHREAAADEESLDVFDWAVDQNFRRHAGIDFDPLFHRFLPADEQGHVRLEGETFIDVRLGRSDRLATFRWRGGEWTVRVPLEASLLWSRVRNLAGGRTWVIAERRQPVWRLLSRRGPMELWEMDRRALPVPPA
ncbi:MAG: metallopeptidase family protein [Gemmatimonadetes bacterium]|nr:metallopeptidase family protein [Gemmatimonadota bacterium]MBT8479106.1 metallopeptidase family protein [Gemmatimonadota bacterium]NNK49950.1 hypothetical protein [Gemmatimonadota bacterium]